jgi:hypothetical protein
MLTYMSKKRLAVLIFGWVALALPLLAAACTGFADREDPSAAYTAGANTLIARLTREAGETAVAQLTQMAAQPTGTQVVPRITPPPKEEASPTPLPEPTETPAPRPPAEAEEPSPTLPAPTFSPIPVPCNAMLLLGDVTVPPDTVFPAGAVFNKVWRVQNTGSCAWSAGYNLVFTGGNLPSASVMAIPVAAPGQTVELSVPLVAPSQAGIYQGSWMLRSDTGDLFGSGADGSVPLFVRIQVPQPVSRPASSYDIAVNYCLGEWTSGAGILFCPGMSGDASGSVILVQAPTLESRRTSGYGLWTRPNQEPDGWISGRTQLLGIRNGDRFVSEVGCLADSPGCDVIFQLDYRAANGATGRLGRWRETYDGFTTPVDVDLSSLSGRNVSLILSVFNRGRARDADAVWLLPRVEQGGAAPRANTLTWTREGRPNQDSCHELQIFHTAANSAVAVAYDCDFGRLELGRVTLNSQQMEQLRTWEARLDDFEGEIYSAAGGNPVQAWVSFRGSGRGIANNAQIRAVESFAAQIFAQITR